MAFGWVVPCASRQASTILLLLCGMLCDSSDMNDALWMFLIQDVVLAPGLWFEVVIVAHA